LISRGGSHLCRPSKWGNPFVIGRRATREEVIAKYRAWIVSQPALMAALNELRGKDLVCWCAPQRCHAEVLIELANPWRLLDIRGGTLCRPTLACPPPESRALRRLRRRVLPRCRSRPHSSILTAISAPD
jgi:Domain of unknown function (DUF4326)